MGGVLEQGGNGRLDSAKKAEKRLKEAFKSSPLDPKKPFDNRTEAGRNIGGLYVDALAKGVDTRRAVQNMLLTLDARIGSRMDNRMALSNALTILEQQRDGFKRAEGEVSNVLGRDYFKRDPHHVDALRSALLKESMRQPDVDAAQFTLTNREDEAVSELERGCKNGQEETDRHLAAAIHFGLEDANRIEDQLNAVGDQMDKVDAELDVLTAEYDVLRLMLKYGEFAEEVKGHIFDPDVAESERPEKLGAFLADRATIEQYVRPTGADTINTYFAALQAAGKIGRPDVKGTLARVRGEREHRTAQAYAEQLVTAVENGAEPVARAEKPLDRDPNK